MLQQNVVEPATLELLKRICALPPFADFALGEDTNSALPLGHRISEDLDFFNNTPYLNNIIIRAITKAFPGAKLLFEQNQKAMFTIDNVKVYFVFYPFKGLMRFETKEGVGLTA